MQFEVQVEATLKSYPHITTVVYVGDGEMGEAGLAWKDFVNTSSNPNPPQVELVQKAFLADSK